MTECRNLRNEMRKCKLSYEVLARGVGISDRELIAKISGKNDFSWEEAKAIQRRYFPYKSKDYLFERQSDVVI